MISDPVTRIAYWIDAVAPNTEWAFVSLETAAGIQGIGEATLTGHHADVASACRGLAGLVFSLHHASPRLLPADYPLESVAAAAAYCAVDQALWDIEGQRMGQSASHLLSGSGSPRAFVPLYANINRRTRLRDASGFVESARRAVAAGFESIKIAPFDEISPAVLGTGEVSRAIHLGIERVAAVRETIGPDRDLLVDCHWRFDFATASTVIAELAPHRLQWLECPMPEHTANLNALKRLRALANGRGMRLAGAELCTRRAGFRPFLECGAYDVMMPDAKYAGGLAEMVAIAEEFERAGVLFSPHNPSGPVCHAASLQVSAVAPALDRLEVQFEETAEFSLLQRRRLPEFEHGGSALPSGPGLGVALDYGRVEALAREGWSRRRPD